MSAPASLGFGAQFRLTLVTGDRSLAAQADAGGVDRIGVDLERMGKAMRQAGARARLSMHSVGDLSAIARVIRRASPFVRINPFHDGTTAEVEQVLAAGAGVIMLPLFETAAVAERFVRLVDRRARTILLVETGPALVRAREIFSVGGVSEAMLGLNDLRLALGISSHFEVLTSPLATMLAEEAARAGLPLSAGGVARPHDQGLPVAPDLVLAQYPRLGLSGAWLSRSFVARTSAAATLADGVVSIRRRLDDWAKASPEALEAARTGLAQAARRL